MFSNLSDSESAGAPFRNICLKNALENAFVTANSTSVMENQWHVYHSAS